MNEIRKQLAWISSEYKNMFSTDEIDYQMVAENDKFHCSVLKNMLKAIVEEIIAHDHYVTLADKTIINNLNQKLRNIVDGGYHCHCNLI